MSDETLDYICGTMKGTGDKITYCVNVCWQNQTQNQAYKIPYIKHLTLTEKCDMRRIHLSF